MCPARQRPVALPVTTRAIPRQAPDVGVIPASIRFSAVAPTANTLGACRHVSFTQRSMSSAGSRYREMAEWQAFDGDAGGPAKQKGRAYGAIVRRFGPRLAPEDRLDRAHSVIGEVEVSRHERTG